VSHDWHWEACAVCGAAIIQINDLGFLEEIHGRFCTPERRAYLVESDELAARLLRDTAVPDQLPSLNEALFRKWIDDYTGGTL